MKRAIYRLLLGSACLLTLVYVYSLFSPWPVALFYRFAMNAGGTVISAKLAKHVPPDVRAILDERYDPADSEALLDVFYPAALEAAPKPQTTIVWIHGGGFIAGDKRHVAHYAAILASKGYAVASLNYSLAPGSRYPKPLHQINRALDYLVKNAARYNIDPTRIVIAGDSAGAQLAAQTANIISVPDYAAALKMVPPIERRQLRGVVLHCGFFDPSVLKLDGPAGDFFGTVAWSYFGERDYFRNPKLHEFAVINHITAEFPPVFISVGNADELAPHSERMAKALAAKGVPVDALFFPKEHKPALQHEYQFDLDNEAGKLALERLVQFLTKLK